MNPASNKATKGLLLGIIAIFALPMVFAWIYYHFHQHFSNGTTNYGYLISPPLNLTKLGVKDSSGTTLANPLSQVRTKHDQGKQILGKWLIFTIVPTNQCNPACQTSLYNMRQIRIATNAEQNRVTRATISFNNPQQNAKLNQLISTEYAGTLTLMADSAQFKQQVQVTKLNYAAAEGTVYIADPLGNVILVYPPDADPAKILKDLNHLLQVSQIG